jgi:hypothetical protein
VPSTADFFAACLSANSIRKRGTFQREMRHADCACTAPFDDVYFILVRSRLRRPVAHSPATAIPGSLPGSLRGVGQSSISSAANAAALLRQLLQPLLHVPAIFPSGASSRYFA